MTTLTRTRNPNSLHLSERDSCPCCGARQKRPVLTLSQVPANSCLMLDTAEEARAYPRGDIALVFCSACGFIWNAAFDPQLTEYSDRYEPTQAYSPTFQSFHKGLAQRLVDALDLHGKTVVEVGGGQGEFLHLVCRLGGNRGIGFDPSLDPRRADVVEARADGVRLVGDFFAPETIAGLHADALLSKMTLEHIPAAGRFAQAVAQLARQSGTAFRLFIQIPESERILTEAAFEDIYYEHCNYFTEASLTALFARAGFRIEDVTREYEGQYLAILGRFTGQPGPGPEAGMLARLDALVTRFQAAHAAAVARWQAVVAERARTGRRVVLWGSGSKGVSFLSALAHDAAIAAVVDINPHRQGKFMVGTGHPIVGPDALTMLRPDTVIVMNPVYRAEIARMLADRGLTPELLTL